METEFQNINAQQSILDHGMSVCDEFKKLFTITFYSKSLHMYFIWNTEGLIKCLY